MPTRTARPDDTILDLETAAAWQASIVAAGDVPFWVITSHTKTYPGKFFARAWVAAGSGNGSSVDAVPYSAVLVADSLEAIRGLLPPGMMRIPRSRLDDWAIKETWVS